jgi:hypothetical protein
MPALRDRVSFEHPLSQQLVSAIGDRLWEAANVLVGQSVMTATFQDGNEDLRNRQALPVCNNLEVIGGLEMLLLFLE